MATYKGSCFCGEVKVEVDGEPDAMVVCHCTVCRTWSASPVNGATIFKPENVRIVQGKDKLKRVLRRILGTIEAGVNHVEDMS